jgi:ribosomal protein L16 Arg81 hydroxylase
MEFRDLINPLSLDEFHKKYHRKKFCVIKGNTFRKNYFGGIISWHEFSTYINNDRAVSGLQAILPGGRKLCMEKDNLYMYRKPDWSKEFYYEKEYLHKIWRDNGSIILTKASLLTPNISNIAGAIEKYFKGAADAHFYCSRAKNGWSFPFHRDNDDNWLVHAYGTVRWTVNNSLSNLPDDTTEFDLTAGDLLYIPRGLSHKAVAQTRRISISVPLIERSNAKPVDRKHYDFSKP